MFGGYKLFRRIDASIIKNRTLTDEYYSRDLLLFFVRAIN